ncbi:uncharacterized protein LOC142530498 [Primulina tabacum]|uniref:uncharacterized protein LOC142530498 n=1 Tax=Primulina tabacum TaxID=48773 RepID=UPI003F5999AB
MVERNYHYFGDRSRLGFINGSLKSPESSLPEYEAWLSKDQQVMSWILNLMERDLVEIFCYSESYLDLWNVVRDIYGNQNNSARIFQIHREIANLHQDGKPFLSLIGSLKSFLNELEIYRPPTVDAAILRKRTDDDRIFQLLASINPVFEDLRSHILMNTDLPSFKNICATIQREEVRWKVMPRSINPCPPNVHAYIIRSSSEEKSYKGKRPDLKCQHCHITDRNGQGAIRGGAINQEKDQTAALLSHFAGFLVAANSDTNQVSVANGKNAHVKGKGKIKLVSDTIDSDDLVTKEMIGEGFHLHGLNYVSPNSQGEKLPKLFPLPSIDYGHQSTQGLHPSQATLEHYDDRLDISSVSSREAIIESPEQVLSNTQGEPISSRRNPPRMRHPPTKLADYVAHKSGFTQKFGVDYKETFSPVAKMTMVRVLLSVAINNGWHLFQMDVKNALLHGDLEEEVFMKLPTGHPQSENPNLACQLHKSIYGLKQSPRAWHAKLSTGLEALCFKRSSADSSLYVLLGLVDKLVVLIYVDDLIITGNNTDSIAQLKTKLQHKFPIKDLGSLKYFLGIEMAASNKGLFLNQRKYILDSLQDAEMLHTKPVDIPLDSKLRFASIENP